MAIQKDNITSFRRAAILRWVARQNEETLLAISPGAQQAISRIVDQKTPSETTLITAEAAIFRATNEWNAGAA